MPIRVDNLIPQLYAGARDGTLGGLAVGYPLVFDRFFGAQTYADSAVLFNGLSKQYQHPAMDTLRSEVEEAFDFELLEAELAQAFGQVQQHFPSFVPPRVTVLISGLQQDVYFSTEEIILGLDYFLGPTSPYPPMRMPLYLLRRYTPRHVVPTTIMAISKRYNRTDLSERRLIDDMIFWGKTYFFLENVLPCVADSTLIGYPPRQYEEVLENRAYIWDHFVQNALLYQSDPTTNGRYISERNSVLEIGKSCPGRIGHFIGWEIVRAYAERHPALGLADIMREQNAQKIFTLSGYAPIAAE